MMCIVCIHGYDVFTYVYDAYMHMYDVYLHMCWNRPLQNTLEASEATLGKSHVECRSHMRSLRSNDVVAINAGEVVNHHSLNVVGVVARGDLAPPDQHFWLAVVILAHQKVKRKEGVNVCGKDLKCDDEYIVVQWLELCEGSDDTYVLTHIRECIWEIDAVIPMKRLGTHMQTGLDAGSDEEEDVQAPLYTLNTNTKNKIDALFVTCDNAT